jgi:uncharacterized secreted protein with C-terminal beta-propeller domain
MNINSPEENFSRKLFLAFLISFFALILIIISFLIIYRMAAGPIGFPRIPFVSSPSFTVTKSDLPKCESCNDLKNKLQAFYKESKKKGSYNRFGWGDIAVDSLALPESAPKATGDSSAPSGAGADYSETNIQVAGVDEADIIKTDGKYIYTVSKNILTISSAYPPESAKLLSKIELSSGSNPQEIFIDKDNLLVFGMRNYYYPKDEGQGWTEESPEIYPIPYPSNLTFVEIYNVSNREDPVLKRKLEFDGSYLSSRKIDDYVYFVLNSYPDYRILENDKISGNEIENIIPTYRDFKEKEIDKEKDFEPIVNCSKISYIEPITSAQYISVIGIPVDDYTKEPAKEVILGSSQNIYASLENLYIVNAQYQYSRGIFNAILENTAESREKTEIYKFSLDKGKIQYLTKGEVPGTVLNQFSMDEYDSYFRIATTKRSFGMRRSQPTNNIYILDKDLKITGSVEDIAPGETIYSARFMGKKGYLVTFKKIDPFFTFDLSDPKNPKIIGKLKIPGYSDYLHPYDENHILGIGKNTIEAEEIWGDDFEWHQGIKMAIFDVTDFENPREMHKIVIGDRGSDSPILRDHKAFLFDKDKNLLVIPILLAEIPEDMKKDPERARNMYGEYTFQGSFVCDISLEKGFVLKGRITHYDDDEIFKKSGYYFSGDDFSVKRNLYIENYLYSISDGKILINSLNDLSEAGKIELPKSQSDSPNSDFYPGSIPDFFPRIMQE